MLLRTRSQSTKQHELRFYTLLTAYGICQVDMAVRREPGQSKPLRLQQAVRSKRHRRVRRSWIALAVILVIVVVGFAAVVFCLTDSRQSLSHLVQKASVI